MDRCTSNLRLRKKIRPHWRAPLVSESHGVDTAVALHFVQLARAVKEGVLTQGVVC